MLLHRSYLEQLTHVYKCIRICRGLTGNGFKYFPRLGFFKFQFINGQNGQESGTASLCEILSKSLQPRSRCGNFSIFQDDGRRHLGFSKFETFNVPNGQWGGTAG